MMESQMMDSVMVVRFLEGEELDEEEEVVDG